MTLFKSFIRNKRGGVIVESALILPLMISAGLSGLDASNMLIQNHKLEGQLAMAGTYLSKSDNPVARESAAKNLAVTGDISGTGPARVKGWTAGDITVSYLATSNTNGDYRGESNIETVKIYTELDYKGFGILSSIMPNGITIKAEVQERIVGGGL
ncbi:MAG: hypothetical protein HKN36_13710 [Hellea sp.]|nr:hypothetical protein [Hellea sp.]